MARKGHRSFLDRSDSILLLTQEGILIKDLFGPDIRFFWRAGVTLYDSFPSNLTYFNRLYGSRQHYCSYLDSGVVEILNYASRFLARNSDTEVWLCKFRPPTADSPDRISAIWRYVTLGPPPREGVLALLDPCCPSRRDSSQTRRVLVRRTRLGSFLIP